MAKSKKRNQSKEPCMICGTGNVLYKVVGIGGGTAICVSLDHILQDGEVYLGNMCVYCEEGGGAK